MTKRRRVAPVRLGDDEEWKRIMEAPQLLTKKSSASREVADDKENVFVGSVSPLREEEKEEEEHEARPTPVVVAVTDDDDERTADERIRPLIDLLRTSDCLDASTFEEIAGLEIVPGREGLLAFAKGVRSALGRLIFACARESDMARANQVDKVLCRCNVFFLESGRDEFLPLLHRIHKNGVEEPPLQAPQPPQVQRKESRDSDHTVVKMY